MKTIVITFFILITSAGLLCAVPSMKAYMLIDKEGKTYVGEIRVFAGKVSVLKRDSGGELKYEFKQGDINIIILSDEAGAYSINELNLYEPYFAYMNEPVFVEFSHLCFSNLEQGKVNQCRSIVRRLNHAFTLWRKGLSGTLSPVRSHRITQFEKDMFELDLLLNLHDGRGKLLKRNVNKWLMDSGHYGDSALGWYVLSEYYLSQSEFLKALDTALIPVVFSSQLKMKYLEHCYSIAILSCKKIKDLDQADQLSREMEERGYSIVGGKGMSTETLGASHDIRQKHLFKDYDPQSTDVESVLVANEPESKSPPRRWLPSVKLNKLENEKK